MKKTYLCTDNRGFTLIELAVVIVIIGILAAIIFPQYLKYTANARVKAATTDITSMKTVIDLYFAETDTLPTEGTDETTDGSVGQVLAASDIHLTTLKDPWGNQYQYKLNGTNDYEISSSGPDTTNPADDIVATKAGPPKIRGN